MKVLVLLPESRARKYGRFDRLPKELELVFADYLAPMEQILAVGGDADVLFGDSVAIVPAALTDRMPNLKLVQAEGVGYNYFDVDALTRRGIPMCNNAGANAGAVAEHTVMLMLALLRRLREGDLRVRSGGQEQCKTAFINDGFHCLSGCTVGLIGFGAIGKAVARLLAAFQCKIVYYDPFRAQPEVEEQLGVTYVPLEELPTLCDIISPHMPVIPETTGMFDEAFLRAMKPTAYFVNTARGEVVNQQAMVKALEEGWIAGAAFDVYENEPATLDNPIFRLSERGLSKVLFTPHVAGCALEAIQQMHDNAWENVMRVFRGEQPLRVVNRI